MKNIKIKRPLDFKKDGLKYQELAIWCRENNHTIIEKGDYYITQEIDNSLTDDEIKIQRENLYKQLSDPLFIQVMRGTATPEEYINSVATIKNENKYSYEVDLNYITFYNKTVEAWNKAQPDKQINFLED